MKSGLAATMAVLALGALAGKVSAQAPISQGFRVWVGPSLGNRDYELGKQMFSALGLAKDISPSQNESLIAYLDAFRVVERPVEVIPRVIKEEIAGLGLARVFHLTDKAGVDTYYGFGIGYYRNLRTDSFPGTPKVTTNTVGMKLLVGTNVGGNNFIQGQLTYMSGRNDFQLGFGRRF